MIRREIWKDIYGFDGYQVSNLGNVRSFWKRKHYPNGYGSYWYLSNEPHIMSTSDDGNGYLKLMLYDHKNRRRCCRKVHRLVAEAFIPMPNEYEDWTVDHIRSGEEGKLDNSVDNLRWITRRENIQKAYRDGMCDERIRKQNLDIIAIDLWTSEECYFSSIQEAADILKIDRTAISHVLRGDCCRTKHYRFEYAGREERLLYGDDDNKQLSWIRMGIF